MSVRPVKYMNKAAPTMEGAGVHLHRAFAYVFEGSGIFCDESRPLDVPADSAGWWDTEIPNQAEYNGDRGA